MGQMWSTEGAPSMLGIAAGWVSNKQAAIEAFDAAAQSLLDLAEAEYVLGRIDNAAGILVRAAEAARGLGEQDVRFACVLNRLGVIRFRQGKHDEARRLLKQAVAIAERAKMSGVEPATFLTNLGFVYRAASEPAKARVAFEHALEVAGAGPGEPDQTVVWTLDQLGDLEASEGNMPAALFAFQCALAIKERAGGSNDWNFAVTLSKLGEVYLKQDRYNEAQSCLLRAIAIHERAVGWEHPAMAKPLARLAQLYQRQRKDGQAEQLAGYALKLLASVFPPGHPEIIGCLNLLAGIYRGLGRYADADDVSKLAQALADGTGRHEKITRFILPNPPKLSLPQAPEVQEGGPALQNVA